MPKRDGNALPLSVLGISHYHQRREVEPAGVMIPPGLERVELVTKGRGWVEDAGKWIEVIPGSLIWQIPGDRTISRSDFENPYSCLSVSFEIVDLPGRRVARFTRWDDLVVVREFTDEMIRLWAERTVPMDVLTTYAYGRLYMQALRGQAMLERQQLPDTVQKIREVIEEHFHERLSIPDLARMAGCSEPYLHELFKKHLGKSPHQLILESRLKEASRRLASTQDPIKQIAHDTGFSHSPAFCHAFRRYSGLTPAVYRKQSYMPAD